MAGGREVAQAGKRLINRGRLDDTLIGKLLVRGRGNGESRRRPLSSGARGCVHTALERVGLRSRWLILLRGLSPILLALLNDLSLPFPHVNAPLQLLPHSGVLGVEAW